MDDFELTCRAKIYIEKLANGINPLTDDNVPEGDIVNNVKISRCLFFVADVLEKIIENGGCVQPMRKKKHRERFYVQKDDLKDFEYTDTPITITHVAERINRFVDTANMRRLYYRQILVWLKSAGYLKDANGEYGKSAYCPTQLGANNGISMRKVTRDTGEYYVLCYARRAQEIIVDNIEKIIEIGNK